LLIGSVSGVDTITGALAPAITAYVDGQNFAFTSAGANTGAVTLNLNGVGVKAVTKNGTTALASGDIPSGARVVVSYDGTQFQLINVNPSAVSVDLTSEVTGTLPVANGGTGATAITDKGVVVGSGGTAITTIAPSTSGNVLTSDGTDWSSSAPAGGAWTLIGTQEASNDASLTQTGLDSTYDVYAIVIADMVPATDATKITIRFGDSGGVDSGASDYQYHFSQSDGASGAYSGDGQTQSEIRLSQVGNAAGEGCGAVLFLTRPGDGTTRPHLSGCHASVDDSSNIQGGHIVGMRTAVITLDRVQVICQSGNIASGRFTVYGVSHA
jgi:hypothetical protein